MSTIIQLLDRPIAYNPAFAKLKVGKVKAGPVAAVFLSQMVYWHNRMDGGWMYKTQANITSETALTRDEQETARKRLIALGVLEEDLRGVPATMHYRINAERLEALLVETTKPAKKVSQDKTRLRSIQNVETPQSGLVQSRKQECDNAANKNVETPQTRMVEPHEQASGNPTNFLTGDYTENTQEITQDIKPSCPVAAQPDEPELSPEEKFLQSHPDAHTWNLSKRQWGTEGDLICADWIWKRIRKMYEDAAEQDPNVSIPADPDWNLWANDVRLMRTLDGRTHKQICELYKRVNQDDFWKKNIKSPSKLREQWDEVTLKLSPAVNRPATREDQAFKATHGQVDYSLPENAGFRS